MEISEFISESDTKGMKLFALTQPNPTKKKKKLFIMKKSSIAMGEIGLGEGQGNNHQVKLTNSVLKNLNIF